MGFNRREHKELKEREPLMNANGTLMGTEFTEVNEGNEENN